MNRYDCFWERFKELISDNEYSVKDLENKTGLNHTVIYSYLNKVHIPDLNNAIIIADLFGCPLDFLFGFTDDFTPQRYVLSASVTERFKKAVDNSIYSRYKIAKMTKIAGEQISRWYNGKQTPTLASLVIIADKLECSLDFLAGK